MHDLPLITTIAAAFTAAWVLGLITQSLRLSPIVGYLLAGVLIGPYTPGFVGDTDLAHQLAEVGVILLMFGVGLHFHLKDLLAVRSVAIPGAIGQSLVAALLGVLVFTAFGFSLNTSLVIGMAMSVASTVVLMRVLTDADTLNAPEGHVAVGWLLVEDIFTVVVLVLIPVLGEDPQVTAPTAATNPAIAVGIALAKLVLLVAIVLAAGKRLIPWVLVQVARLRSRELFTLTILVFSIAVAAGAFLAFGASMALGAFLAGMVVAQSPVSHQAAADALPLRDAFAVIFFVSVGMIFDPSFILAEPTMILAALAIILIAKPLAALLLVAALGHSVRTALTVALGLAQIGEFSFILSDVAHKYGLMPEAGHNVLVAAAIISITLNPLLFRSLPRVEIWLRRRPRLWSLLNARAERRMSEVNADAAAKIDERAGDPLQRAIVVGYGPVGRAVDQLLREAGLETAIVDLNMSTISALHQEGRQALFGDASRETILEQAGIAHASHLVLTLPHASESLAVVSAARGINDKLRVLVRARYLSERKELELVGATRAVFEEGEAAVALARLVLSDTGASREVVEQTVRDLRMRLIEHEYLRHPHGFLRDALDRGGTQLRLEATTPDDAIRELAGLIPTERLPGEANVAELAIARERELPTDVGLGVAIPHARCAGLREPILVVGCSAEGIVFDARSNEPVRLIFLLVTPSEHPDQQVLLLGQLASIAGSAALRQQLCEAESAEAIVELIAKADPAG